MQNHKGASAFLIILSIVSLIGGVIVQLTLLFGWDFVSVIPIAEMGTQQILYINFLSVYAVISLISIIVALLALPDFSVSELFTSSGVASMILPAILFFVSIYTSLGTSSITEKIICLAISAGFILSNVINFGAIAMLKGE